MTVDPKRDKYQVLSLSRTRLFRELLLYAGLLALLAATTLTVLAWLTAQSLESQIDAGLEAEAHAWANINPESIPRSMLQPGSNTDSAGLFDPEDAGPRFYTLIRPHESLPANDVPALTDQQIAESQRHPVTVDVPAEFVAKAGLDDAVRELRVISQPLGDGRILIISQALNEANELIDGIILSAAVGVGFIVLFGFLGGYGAGRRVIRHFQRIARTADELARGDLKYRLPARVPGDEFDTIAEIINGMLNRIEALVTQVRDVSQSVAHDLRSPLTRVRNHLEEISTKEKREDVPLIIEELDDVLATFNSILQISGLESGGVAVEMHPIDVTEITAEIAEMYAPSAEADGMELIVDRKCPLWIIGSRELLGKAIANLLDNVLKHCPAGTRIQVGTANTGDIAAVYVTDNGPGIPDAFHEKAFERFFRCDAARSTPGNGLGLAMVKAIVEVHHGSVTLVDNDPGLRVELRLPIVDSAMRDRPAIDQEHPEGDQGHT